MNDAETSNCKNNKVRFQSKIYSNCRVKGKKTKETGWGCGGPKKNQSKIQVVI